MELEILNYLAARGGSAPYGDILNAFPDILETNGLLYLLRKDDFIRGDFSSFSTVSITKEGCGQRTRLLENQQQLQHYADQRTAEMAERRADQKKNDRFNKCSMVINIITAVLALLALAVSVYDVLC